MPEIFLRAAIVNTIASPVVKYLYMNHIYGEPTGFAIWSPLSVVFILLLAGSGYFFSAEAERLQKALTAN